MRTKPLSRRDALKVMSLGIATTVLASCGSSAPTPTATPAPKAAGTSVPSAPAKPIKLSYWGHSFAGREAVVKVVVEDFLKEFPGSEITLDSIAWSDLETKLATAFAAQSEPDVWSAGDWIIPAYVERNLVAPIDPSAWKYSTQQQLVDQFEPGTVENLMWKDKLYAYPMEFSIQTPTYRFDHLKELGLDPAKPPDTYEDWVDAGIKGTKRDAEGRMTRQWFEWRYGQNAAYIFQYMGPMLLGLGGDWINKEGTGGGLSTDAGMQMLQFFTDTIHTWKITDPAFTTAEPGGLIIAGKETYYWRNFPGCVQAETTFKVKYNVDWGLQPMFKWRNGKRYTIKYGLAFMVGARSKVQKDAQGFVEYMTRFPNRTAQWITVGGLVQPRKGWADLPVVKDYPWNSFWQAEFKYAVPMPRTTKYNEIAQEIMKQIGRLVARPPDPVKDVAADCDKAIARILKG